MNSKSKFNDHFQNDGWTLVRDARKEKAKIQRELAKSNSLKQDEVANIGDITLLDMKTRWELYRAWRTIHMASLASRYVDIYFQVSLKNSY